MIDDKNLARYFNMLDEVLYTVYSMSDNEIPEKIEEEEKIPISHEHPGYMGEEEVEEREKPILIIIDDDKKTRKTVKNAFKKEFDVVDLEDGKNCIKILIEERPTLLLLSEDTSTVDGWSIMGKIEDESMYSQVWMRDLPIVMLSDKEPTLELSQRSNIEKIVDYITKPFEKEEIQERVDRLIKKLEKSKKISDTARNRSVRVGEEYERISKALYLRQRLIKPVREELKKIREEGDVEELIKFEKALNDQMATINFYRRRTKEIEALAKKWKDVEKPEFMQK